MAILPEVALWDRGFVQGDGGLAGLTQVNVGDLGGLHVIGQVAHFIKGGKLLLQFRGIGPEVDFAQVSGQYQVTGITPVNGLNRHWTVVNSGIDLGPIALELGL